MKLHTFNQFVNENLNHLREKPESRFDMMISKKVNCFSGEHWFAIDLSTGVDEIYAITQQDLFNVIKQLDFVGNTKKINDGLPALGYVATYTQSVLDAGYSPNLMYNLPEDSLKLRKVNLYRDLNDRGSTYVSKTVFKIEDVKTLKFPIIAKAEASWQSKGVKKFDTFEEITRSEIEFDLYQEAFKIDKEYRAIIFKGKKDQTPKLLTMSLRKPANEKAQSLRVTEGTGHDDIANNESSKFTWTTVDIFNGDEHCPDLKEISNIVKDVMSVSPNMNVFAIDVAVDTSGKHWLIEANTQPGQNGITPHLMYLNMVQDFYGLKISGPDIDKMKTSMYKSITATGKYLLGYQIPECLYSNPAFWYGVNL
jgi:hypothetical protein